MRRQSSSAFSAGTKRRIVFVAHRVALQLAHLLGEEVGILGAPVLGDATLGDLLCHLLVRAGEIVVELQRLGGGATRVEAVVIVEALLAVVPHHRAPLDQLDVMGLGEAHLGRIDNRFVIQERD